jgi:hypothetical protein
MADGDSDDNCNYSLCSARPSVVYFYTAELSRFKDVPVNFVARSVWLQ